MNPSTGTPPTEPTPSRGASPGRCGVWLSVAVVSLAILFGLDYLLGLVIWLPLYSGLFGYLVAGLIAGGASFRMARKLRPVSRGGILVWSVLLALINTAPALYWEYHHVASGVSDMKGFVKLRIRAVNAGKPRSEVVERIDKEFERRLREGYPPGGFIGYARWCIQSGELPVMVDDAGDTVRVSHRGAAWLIRTIAAWILTCLGLWFSYDGLRAGHPVSNTLAPGEEYEEIDD